MDGFERDIGQRLEVEEAGAAGSWARAYTGATFEPGETQETQSRELVALLAAIATDPALLEPLRRRFEAWQARAEDDGLDLALATLLRLAANGLWFADLFGLAPPAGELRGRVLKGDQRAGARRGGRMSWLLLVASIVLEVLGTVSMKLSEGFKQAPVVGARGGLLRSEHCGAGARHQSHRGERGLRGVVGVGHGFYRDGGGERLRRGTDRGQGCRSGSHRGGGGDAQYGQPDARAKRPSTQRREEAFSGVLRVVVG